MTKLVWLSDLHFSADGPVFGIDTRARVEAAVAYINTHYPEAEGCVISGDLVNRGTARDYAELSAALAGLSVPVWPMVGNHDNRLLLKGHLPVPYTAMTDFIQYKVDLPGVTLLCLDTQKEGKDGGAFCDERTAWLEEHLNQDTGLPTLVFTHHPPLALELPMQDQDCLKDNGRLVDALSRSSLQTYLCCGHVHRPTSGIANGIPFLTLRSALYQAPPPRPAWTWATFTPAHEAPQLAVLSVKDAGITIQLHDFCAPDLGMA